MRLTSAVRSVRTEEDFAWGVADRGPAEGEFDPDRAFVARDPDSAPNGFLAMEARARRQLSSGRELLRRREAIHRETPFPFDVPALDARLHGGVERGTFLEIHGNRSAGRMALLLSLLARTTAPGGAGSPCPRTGVAALGMTVNEAARSRQHSSAPSKSRAKHSTAVECAQSACLIDLGDGLDVEAAVLAGCDLTRVLWVRAGQLKQAVMAAEIAISGGFPLVVLDLGAPPIAGISRLAEGAWVRLQRTAEAQRAAFVLSTPYRLSGPAATTVLRAAPGRGLWSGRGDEPRLLAALDARLGIEKARRGAGNVADGAREDGREIALPFVAREMGAWEVEREVRQATRHAGTRVVAERVSPGSSASLRTTRKASSSPSSRSLLDLSSSAFERPTTEAPTRNRTPIAPPPDLLPLSAFSPLPPPPTPPAPDLHPAT